MGEIVTGQARELEVRDLINQAAVFSAERQIFADIKINAAAVNKCGLRLIVAGIVANADE